MSSIRQRNQQLILEAASEEFASKGYNAAQTRDIAARAGVPKANLYYYFQTKENLYTRVLMAFLEPLLAASAVLRASDAPQVALPAYIQARIRIVRDHPYTSNVFSSELLHGAKQLPGVCRDLLRAEAQLNVHCLNSWIKRGLIAPVDPQHLMLFIWSATRTYTNFGWRMAQLTGVYAPQGDDYALAAATITRLVLQGTTPGMPAPRPMRPTN
ncbi:TetR/AcrR family transcriptional regulator [Pseudomonas qingdaonensis]|uniref:TetR/AcrR family transcriptional regulator n=1 Tax=Pseudomonas qingdaonensis TaxID=2056231 RepID=UPI00242E54C3|nr:TetR/AcrR family transcriptional regulator [Pseudomonas qingdaonensis]